MFTCRESSKYTSLNTEQQNDPLFWKYSLSDKIPYFSLKAKNNLFWNSGINTSQPLVMAEDGLVRIRHWGTPPLPRWTCFHVLGFEVLHFLCWSLLKYVLIGQGEKKEQNCHFVMSCGCFMSIVGFVNRKLTLSPVLNFPPFSIWDLSISRTLLN